MVLEQVLRLDMEEKKSGPKLGQCRVGFECPKGHAPINIHALQPGPTNFATLVGSSSAAAAELLRACTTGAAFRKESSKCAQVFPLLNAASIIVDTVI